ncbi:UBP-type zinc finger domain-containing protein [Caenimonas sp. S4]|nr:UBP-type zinc finger domain-containing protein [Caenimonas soli]
MDVSEAVDPAALPSGTGCAECLAAGLWWLHLRRCAKCGHIGCCDTSPNQHATKHFHETGHFIMRSFEPGEDWCWDYKRKKAFFGLKLADPQSHPVDQPVPGPEGLVPANWKAYLHD